MQHIFHFSLNLFYQQDKAVNMWIRCFTISWIHEVGIQFCIVSILNSFYYDILFSEFFYSILLDSLNNFSDVLPAFTYASAIDNLGSIF